MPISATSIPSVSLLYRLKKLLPAVGGAAAATPQPSQSLNDRIGLVRGDITNLKVDAIVNAANNSLLGGGGVDGAIHRAAGPDLLKECRTLGGCKTGSAKITDAYELPCKKVIHAVGPIYDAVEADVSERNLAGCYTSSLKLAADNNCRTIAFSALSTGVYGYPSHEAAPVAIRAVKEFLQGEDGNKIDMAIFVTFVSKDVEAYNFWLPHFFPSTEPNNKQEEESGKSKENKAADNEATEIKGVRDPESAETTGQLQQPDQPELQNSTKESEEAESKDQVQLPDVPSGEPDDEGPATKKQKSDA